MYAIHAKKLPPLLNSRRQIFKHCFCVCPVDASVCNGDAILQPASTFGRNLLVACDDMSVAFPHARRSMLTLIDIALDHDSHNACLASRDLLGEDASDLGLVVVVL